MSSNLPPLPPLPHWSALPPSHQHHDADQIREYARAYGEACAAAEREAWKRAISEAIGEPADSSDYWQKMAAARWLEWFVAEQRAKAIRARGET